MTSPDHNPTSRSGAPGGSDERPVDLNERLHWRATVVREGSDLVWKETDIPDTPLAECVFGAHSAIDPHSLWHRVVAADLVPLTAVSDNAILSDLGGYDHEFRVIHYGALYWLRVSVRIRTVAADQWALTGIIFDITADRETQQSELSLVEDVQQILKVADCLLWRARAFQRVGGPGADWVLYIPPSNLYRKLFGENPPKHPIELWSPQMVPDLAEMNARSLAAMRGGAPEYEQEYRVILNGRTLWMHEHVSITRVGTGEWLLTGILMDVTATHEAEEARQKRDAELSQVVAAADCLIWHSIVTSDGHGGYRWDTNAARSALHTKLFGGEPDCTKRERILFDWNALKVAEVGEMSRRYRDALERGLPGYEQEFRATVDGKSYWLREQVTIKRLAPGRFDLAGVITDVSARREAEQALATEKERLAVTLRAMTDGVITADIHGRVQYMNSQATLLTECDASAATGRPIGEVCRLQGESGGKPPGLSFELVAEGDRVIELPPQTHLVTPSGIRRVVEGSWAPIHSADSQVVGMVLVFRDVTVRDRLDQELVQASRLESVGILAGGIAHDFNNILTAVIGNLTLAKLDLSAASDTAGYVREAERAAMRARDLTQQLLTFAKGGEPVRGVVDLAAMVREVSEFALHGSTVKGVYDLPEDLWPVDADKGQIGRVVQNLVINALQAMPDGGVVHISASNELESGTGHASLRPGEYVHFVVRDSGVGIKAEHLPRIFDPYFTTKQTGSGLGLAAAYSIVKKHRGLIEVESECGRGTTFHVRLPALRGLKADREPGLAGRIATFQGRVLFMDDDPSIRLMATALMPRLGLEIMAVSDGREAIRAYQAAVADGRPFSLVIMDLTVPGGMGGREAIERLREIDPAVKAIVSSGYSSDPVLANYRDYGFCGLISKPCDLAGYTRAIGKALGAGPG